MSLIKRISRKISQPKHIPLPFEHQKVQDFLNQSPEIVRASIVETYGREVRCEVEDAVGTVTHLGSGVSSIGIWLRVIAARDGFEVPEGLKQNE